MSRIVGRAAPALLAAALTVASAQTVLASPAAVGVSYHVDAAQGDDNASGVDSAHAWRSLARVNRATFQPGDQILLRAGLGPFEEDRRHRLRHHRRERQRADGAQRIPDRGVRSAGPFRIAGRQPGAAISDNGGRDHAGTPLYNGKPGIGAFEVG